MSNELIVLIVTGFVVIISIGVLYYVCSKDDKECGTKIEAEK